MGQHKIELQLIVLTKSFITTEMLLRKDGIGTSFVTKC